jgi:hypothetical protein
MTADELIDGYVAEVIMLLPRRQRRDVAQELRALLTEEVDGAAGAHPTREAAARAVVEAFGRPAVVAARYGSPVAIIDPVDTRQFLLYAGGGAVFILYAGLLGGLVNGLPPADLQQAVNRTWPAVFAWLGILVVIFGVLAWYRRRFPASIVWRPRRLPRIQINRPLRVAAIAFFIAGTAALVHPQWLIRFVTGGRAGQAAFDAFVYDEGFLHSFAVVVLALQIVGIGMQVVLLIRGRYEPWVFWFETAYALVLCAVLTSALAHGPIFSAPTTDQTARSAVAGIVLGSLLSIAIRARRVNVVQAVEAGAVQ